LLYNCVPVSPCNPVQMLSGSEIPAGFKIDIVNLNFFNLVGRCMLNSS